MTVNETQAFTITPAAHYHVADVLVDGVSVGTPTSYTFTNVVADHTIEASFAITTHTIVASAGANGSITPSGSVTVNDGDDQAFTITPAAHYHVADVLVDGVSVGTPTSYTFTNVTTDHTIAASFAITQHTILATAGSNGSITPSGSVAVDDGNDQAFTIAGDVNYHVADVLVDGVSVGAVGTYTFTNVTTDHTIAASFAINAHTITASASAGGSITPSGAVSVNHGDSQAFTITADAGHHTVDVLVDAVSVGAVASYTFTNVTADHTIAASFVVNPAVPALTLTASQVKTGNDTDGTTKILLSWPALPASSSVAVYRAPFGSYPEYDDLAGAAPTAPSFPPSGPWTLTSVTASNTTDETTERDFYYYVAFVTDTFGTVSPVSNVAGGVLNYHLGDVTDGSTPGQGNNAVDIADVSLLGSHYGLTGAAVTAYDYLDVGPTTNASVNARPTTDNRIDFEDLILFAINYQLVSAPQSAARPVFEAASADEVSLDRPSVFGADGRMTAHLNLRGTGMVQGLSLKLTWDPAVVTLESTAPGQMADDLGALVLTGAPGTVDVAMLGVSSGLQGEGTIANVTFRRIGPGDPAIALASADGRDAGNAHVTVAVKTTGVPMAPLVTAFSRIAPNPFRANANLSFALARGGAVELVLYSVDGRMVRRLVNGTREAGQYQVAWDGRDEHGSLVPAGVYYARLVTRDGTFNRSLVYLK
ncbi:MAG: FlgD immunoglobulin-like domain containing protein [Candidatus Eisenbacteria bacterium]